MAKSPSVSMAFLAAIAYFALLATTSSTGGDSSHVVVHAFQASSRQLNTVAIASSSSTSMVHPSPSCAIRGGVGSGGIQFPSHHHQQQQRHQLHHRCRHQSITSIEMKTRISDINMDGTSFDTSPSSSSSLFPSSTPRPILQKIRRKVTTLLASLAFFLSLLSPAHASSTTASASLSYYPTTSSSSSSSTTTISLVQRLNPFRTQSTNEMIDNYVKSKLFDDDVYDPVESAYREAIVDHSTSGSSIGKKDGKMGGMEGAYPTLLAETANAALGQQRSVSSLLSSSSTSSSSNVLSKNKDTKNDGLTSLLITAADFLQTKLGISASTSYSIVAGVGIVGICVVPAGLGVLYQSIQRMQIDRSEMKMYGKIADLDATSKRETDDDEDDEEED